ncbi:hypothetical protein TWF694_008285 [Orbilia ellipsospora]|uniref:Uncharacterized protein n=1 Tax=Orbilia ellipsospora TaxID=2528407 RepID=A0AAV9XG21_9PEZI
MRHQLARTYQFLIANVSFTQVLAFPSGSEPKRSLSLIELSEASLPKRQLDPPINLEASDYVYGWNYDYDSISCQVGVWKDRDYTPALGGKYAPSWQGYPLGDPAQALYDNNCVSMKGRNSGLDHTVSSYVVTGWCECEFYDSDDCSTGSRFTAYNRADGDLAHNGNDNDSLGSFKCWYTNHRDQFDNCTVAIFSGREGLGVNLKQYLFNPDPTNGGTPCLTFGADCPVIKYKINGCNCMFYPTRDCTGPSAFQGGNAGKTIQNVKRTKISSYRCLLPYGIDWNPQRDDIPT